MRAGLVLFITLCMIRRPVRKSTTARLKTKMFVFVCSCLFVEMTTTTRALPLHISTIMIISATVSMTPPVAFFSSVGNSVLLSVDESCSISDILVEIPASSVTFVKGENQG